MSQHDFTLDNANGATFRADLNSAIEAIVTLSSGATAPSPTFANQWWTDTSTNIIKRRNNANTAWLTVMQMATTELAPLANATLSAPTINYATVNGSRIAQAGAGEAIIDYSTGYRCDVPSGAGYTYSVNNGNIVTFSSTGGITAQSTVRGPSMSINRALGTGVFDVQNTTGTEGDVIARLSDSTPTQMVIFYNSNSGAFGNAALCVQNMSKSVTTNRSINAAGTVNASGADYAEYETLATSVAHGVIAKGDIVGFDANGHVTNVFADSVTFGIKSSDPSLVGGDVWGSEEILGLAMPEKPSSDDAELIAAYEHEKAIFDAALEAARQRVERIAYSGKVPVNLPDGVTASPGDWIVPEESPTGGIIGASISHASITFEQLKTAVGQVRNIGLDGRPVVKVS